VSLEKHWLPLYHAPRGSRPAAIPRPRASRHRAAAGLPAAGLVQRPRLCSSSARGLTSGRVDRRGHLFGVDLLAQPVALGFGALAFRSALGARRQANGQVPLERLRGPPAQEAKQLLINRAFHRAVQGATSACESNFDCMAQSLRTLLGTCWRSVWSGTSCMCGHTMSAVSHSGTYASVAPSARSHAVCAHILATTCIKLAQVSRIMRLHCAPYLSTPHERPSSTSRRP